MPIPLLAVPAAARFVRDNFKTLVVTAIIAGLVGSTLYYRLRYDVARETIRNKDAAIALVTGERNQLRNSLDEQNAAILARQEAELARQAAVATAMRDAQALADRRMGLASALLAAKPGADPCTSADALINQWIDKR